LTFWLNNSKIRLTQLKPTEPGRYQGSWAGISYSFAVTRHGKGQRHRRHPYVFACTKTVDGHRLMTSTAGCDPGTPDISSKAP
jgi:hypothetical protein